MMQPIPPESPKREQPPSPKADAPISNQPPPATEADAEQGDPWGGHSKEALTNILESALFAAGAALSVSHLAGMFEAHERPHVAAIREIMAELMEFYQGRGICLVEVASGFRLQTATNSAQWIAKLWEEKPQRYSRALLETLALIAYRQPITRAEIEDVRGVGVSTSITRTLVEREWVRVVGHRDIPGRPAMYATTRQFLDYFGLKSLDQLPPLSELRDIEEIEPQLALQEESAAAPPTDAQSELSFTRVIDDLRATEDASKTGSPFLDEQLDDELASMDAINAKFEHAMARQQAEHEHPGLAFDEDEKGVLEAGEQTASDESAIQAAEEIAANEESATAETEEERWKRMQERLLKPDAKTDASNDSNP